MRGSSRRLGLVVAALFFGYQGLVGFISPLLTLLGQPLSPDVWLICVLALLAPLPYAIAAFFVFAFWRAPRGPGGMALRALLATACGAVIAALIGLLTSLQVSGPIFTSMPRQYSIGDYALVPYTLVLGFLHGLPVMLVAAFVAAWLLRGSRLAEFDRADAFE